MKTVTEFFGLHLKNASKTHQEVVASGKTPEELPAALIEALKPVIKIADDKVPLLLLALETVGNRLQDLKRVVVFTAAEGEKAPDGALKKGEHYFLVEHFTTQKQNTEPAYEGRGGKGGRGDKKGKPGGRDGQRGGRDGDRGGGRPAPAGDRPNGPSAVKVGERPRGPGAPGAGGSESRRPRPPRGDAPIAQHREGGGLPRPLAVPVPVKSGSSLPVAAAPSGSLPKPRVISPMASTPESMEANKEATAASTSSNEAPAQSESDSSASTS